METEDKSEQGGYVDWCKIADEKQALIDELVEGLTTMTALVQLRYGNLDKGIWNEIEAMKALITKATK